MRFVDFKNGIKARINEMLGTSDNAATGNELTYWSLQAAMLTNLRRIVSSLVGDAANGRIMKGLRVQEESTNQINILPGFAAGRDINIIQSQHVMLQTAGCRRPFSRNFRSNLCFG